MRKRRRLKILACLGPPPIMSVPWDSLAHGLVAVLAPANWPELILPALGFGSGAALYLSRSRNLLLSDENTRNRIAWGARAIGDWILIASPTPFNRCVLLRCPSVSFEGGGLLLDDLNDQLVREERSTVYLSRGRILANEEADAEVNGVSYQRLCIGTEDGGVIALDWPEDLELAGEQGLDTTVLIVPGTPEGSMDGKVRAFVREALGHGSFPIVMNPRGCAGSPLTTPRLFTAADSDDINTVVRFINKSRPWTTLMSVGWGYGASMLTKYLAEMGERTPLTAAVCIDNPFDLNEATKFHPRLSRIDEKLMDGLVDILQANKELFKGKNKDFNVVKALSARSVRDFEAAISMISYGFQSIEDFYTKFSTKELVHKVKIPLLFIQNDGEIVPLCSIPRSSIAENPCTSLLLYSHSPNVVRNKRSAVIWCQNLAIEWFSAVELALLKGRHPLLKDVDITITPPKSLAFIEERSGKDISAEDKMHGAYDSNKHRRKRRQFLKLDNSHASSDSLVIPISSLPGKNDYAYQGNAKLGETRVGDHLNDTIETQESSLVRGSEEGEGNLTDSENSQVIGPASVLLNMLDFTIPGTLDDEQKKKILRATEQGETFMKALEEAVPEDVRGKLTYAVSGIIQAQGSKINVDILKKIGRVPGMESGRKSKIQEEPGDISNVIEPNVTSLSDDREGFIHDQETINGNSSVPRRQDHKSQEKNEISPEKDLEDPGYSGPESEIEGNTKSGEPEKAIALDTGNGLNQTQVVDVKESNDPSNSEAEKVDATDDNSIANSLGSNEKSHTYDSSSPVHQELQKEGNNIKDNGNGNVQNTTKFEDPSSKRSSDNPPSISVSNALDALTGFDDSTQMAMNSVFGVIENMIDKLEKETGKTDGEGSKDDTLECDDPAEESLTTSDHKSEDSVSKNVSLQNLNAIRSGHPLIRFPDQPPDTEGDLRNEKEVIDGHNLTDSGVFATLPRDNVSSDYLNKVGDIKKMCLAFNVNQYWGFPYRAFRHKSMPSQMSNVESLDLKSTTDLFLDPEEGRWKMLDQMENMNFNQNAEDIDSDQIIQSMLQEADGDRLGEPSSAFLDSEHANSLARTEKQPDHDSFAKDEVVLLIRETVLNALKVEVSRRLGNSDLQDTDSNIMHDILQVSIAVSSAVVRDRELSPGYLRSTSVKLGTIQGQLIIRTISCVVRDTSLGKVLPVGVIVGSTLASLRKYFHVTVLHNEYQVKDATEPPINIENRHNGEECEVENVHVTLGKKDQNIDLDSQHLGGTVTAETSNLHNGGAVAGAFTAALGASALLAHHQKNKLHRSGNTAEFSSGPMGGVEESVKLPDKLQEVVQDKQQNNLVSTLAEKAMSVAGPVVPTRDDGEVDHERLVASLAELGQRGGILRLIGKAALLWGGLRGAMSLTDRLISFLQLARRPLFQRLLGFICMVLVVWSPVVIPLFPSLVESRMLRSTKGVAEYACILGLYIAVMILVVLWGRRIREYEDPLQRYGLDFRSSKVVQHFLKGFGGGITVVVYIHSINALLGFVSLARPPIHSSPSVHAAVLLKTYAWMLIRTLQGIVTATCIAMVEEVLFRSWLPEEIAADLGYYNALMISGLIFSLLQRSLTSIPGFLLLSLALCGPSKDRHNGGQPRRPGRWVLVLQADTPFWLASSYPWRPFDGAAGLAVCLLLAVYLRPRRVLRSDAEP
ncbi:unnamed protein product [Spirodela intermedia]|uniref:DUF7750 domain-containing protein n=1 Tax=Spirodela intermedia TaxID=51605 RepID=A0A7I8J3M1_SPIIN|nr:unnamed protein product [Spirodela intermedia]CAA6664593.1 unnamed protein product [Spirodela intermedia]